ncbi:MAG TPA: hypothetical protein VG146_12585 [Verrucomicrobiae bacterium]|nr:hypothetical protein [Verrucomicrobiae bacterium]
MKMTKSLLLSATIVAAFATNVRADNLAALAAKASAIVNGPVIASPHGLEEFQWLTRQSQTSTGAVARANRVPSYIRKNSALAASPRVREDFPALGRGGQSPTLTTAKPIVSVNEFNRVTKDQAWAASPRVKEEFPWLARGYTNDSIQVAPLK